MDEARLEALLYQDESDKLDVKRDQYPFEGETDPVKGELLKDILAFANSWALTDTYILVGVDEVKGGRAKLVGVNNHLNDNDLQQFVNSKTQRPITFSYRAFPFEGRQIGIIHVPAQTRPFHLTKDYGLLQAEKVYIRRGSSTGVASLDEVAAMGRASAATQQIPELKIEFSDPVGHELLGESISVTAVKLEIPSREEIPDYHGQDDFSFVNNRDYYRELAHYVRATRRMNEIELAITNTGSSTARDVHIEGKLSGEGIAMFSRSVLPSEPRASRPRHEIWDLQAMPAVVPDITATETEGGWWIVADFGKCKPKHTDYTRTRIYLYAKASTEVTFVGRVFADDLPDPIECRLSISVAVEQSNLELQELLAMGGESR